MTQSLPQQDPALRETARAERPPFAVGCVIGYVEEAMEAERRLRKGDRQLWCGTCNKWGWIETCDHPGRMTVREFDAEARRIKKEVARRYPSLETRLTQEFKAARKRGEA